MVVEAAVVGVEQGARPERLLPAGPGIPSQVVQGENLVKMGEIVFSGFAGEVVPQMLKRSDGPMTIERLGGIR